LHLPLPIVSYKRTAQQPDEDCGKEDFKSSSLYISEIFLETCS